MTEEGNCPDRETLEALLFGKLPPELEPVVNGHVEQCAVCEARAQQIEQRTDPLLDALRRAPSEPPVAPNDTMKMAPEAPWGHTPQSLEGYRILEEIGRGGMGVVYRAHQHRLNRVVAIKMILAGQLALAEDRVRFQMEGELLARLHHPNFVQVYEVGTLERAPGAIQPYLVLEHVNGGSLKQKLKEQPLGWREAAGLVLVLARAMEAAHAQGIVHRDLKPANVLIAGDGTLKITDFGLAKELGGDTSVTPAGATLGTPGYMAPEQARSEAVGPAVDVYALGAILYELLSGRPPFVGDTPVAVVVQLLHEAPTPLRQLRPDVPRDLEVICLHCLEKEPGQRYLRAADLANDLECWLENRPILARRAGMLERTSKWIRRHPLPAALLVFLVASLVLGSAISTYFGITAVNRANEARLALTNEETARQLAEQATEAERWERYVAEITAAASVLQLHDVGAARLALSAAPDKYHNWEWRHFFSQLDGARNVLRGHQDNVWSLSFSPDGTQLASSSADRSVRLWKVASGGVQKILRVPGGHQRDAQFNPAGNRLIAGGDRLRMWDPATGEILWSVPEGKEAYDTAWSADSKRVAQWEPDGRLTVRDATTGKEIFWRDGDPNRRAMAVSPDGNYVAASRPDFTVAVWEVATGKERMVLRHRERVTAIAYSPDGRRIATGSLFPENEVRLWDATTGALLATCSGHANEVAVLAFSPDGQRLASGSMDQTVRLWDGSTGAPLATLEGHTSFVKDLAFSPDSKELISASEDQTLRLWDVGAGRLIAVLHGHVGALRSCRYSPDGAVIASAANDHTVRLWDAKLVARNGVLSGHSKYVYDVAFNPNGAQVASAAWDGTVRLWDPTTGTETGRLEHKTPLVTSLAYSPDGRQLAAVVRAEGVWLWDLATRKQVRLWKGFADSWRGDTRIAFHPQGKLLAWGSLAGPVRLWDTTTGHDVATLTGHEGATRDVAFRSDGKQLASGGEDGTVRLWDMTTHKTTNVLRCPGDIYRIAYSPDNRLLAAGTGKNSVCIWRLDTNEQIGVVPFAGAVYGVAFSPDGTRLACACADNTIRLLDVGRLREVANLRGHNAYVHAVQFSPDGTRLASGSGDFTVRIWDTLSAQERAEAAERRAAGR